MFLVLITISCSFTCLEFDISTNHKTKWIDYLNIHYITPVHHNNSQIRLAILPIELKREKKKTSKSLVRSQDWRELLESGIIDDDDDEDEADEWSGCITTSSSFSPRSLSKSPMHSSGPPTPFISLSPLFLRRHASCYFVHLYTFHPY